MASIDGSSDRNERLTHLFAELEGTSEQLYAMWRDDPNAEIDDVAEAIAADLSLRTSASRVDGEARREGTPRVSPMLSSRTGGAPSPHSARSRANGQAPESGAESSAHADFSGTWCLVQSINFKEYLEATGVPWTKRKVALKLKPVQEWSVVSEGVWELSMRTPVGRKVERIVVNGTVEDEIDGHKVLKDSSWEREELVTLCRPREPSPGVTPTLFRRRVEAQNRMILEIATGEASCTRIFERLRRPPIAPNPKG
jgi:hypothetical protein